MIPWHELWDAEPGLRPIGLFFEAEETNRLCICGGTRDGASQTIIAPDAVASALCFAQAVKWIQKHRALKIFGGSDSNVAVRIDEHIVGESESLCREGWALFSGESIDAAIFAAGNYPVTVEWRNRFVR